MKVPFVISICLFLSFTAQAQYTENSALASGQCMKIGIVKSGVYSISADFLQSAGFNLNTLNPQKLHIYGYGGGMLPQANSSSRFDDLPENAILIQGEADGKMDAQDRLIFYAEGADKVSYNPTTQRLEHQKNLYADTAYYFIVLNEQAGLRVQNQPTVAGATFTADIFNDFQYYEKDLTNILKSGRAWYGELFGFQNEYTFPFDLTGFVPNTQLQITAAAMARDDRSTTFKTLLNTQEIGTMNVPAVSLGTYDPKGADVSSTFTANTNALNTPNANIVVRYDQKGGFGIGYLNYLAINYQRQLKHYGNQTSFRSFGSLNHTVSDFAIGDATADMQVWDITEKTRAKNQAFLLTGNQAVFGANTTALKEFIAFRPANLDAPLFIKSISNQNLHALAAPDLLIVTPAGFLTEAQRLADFRRTHDNLIVEIVTTEQIYNEFGSGRQDISAVRDFARVLYQKGGNTFRYLLLFGDASFDYKQRTSKNTNFVPVYEARESLHPIRSYSSDDYFGFLDSNEGEWAEEGTTNAQNMDIGVGRLPIKSLAEAKIVVDKLINYATNPNALGEWRNRITYVADDGDNNTHQLHADILAEEIERKVAPYRNEKLYLDAFEQISTASGEISPTMTTALRQSVEGGSLIVNFAGHGSEIGWMQEQILRTEDIKQWRNPNNLPLFITATCEFGRYDDPNEVSGAEEVLLNQFGGGIGLITTTRPVFSSTNLILNQALFDYLFIPINGEMPRLGDLIRLTKNASQNSGVVNRNFALLGDPAMRLAYPEYTAEITKINGKSLEMPTDTLKALRKMTLEGEIKQGENLVSDFNGTLTATIFDKRQTTQTKGTESAKMSYQVRNVILFKGLAEVKNGKFQFEFVVPKDINYSFGKGKIALYAYNQSKTADANGALTTITVGGSIPNPPTDNTPPTVQAFMNDEQFKSGGKVGTDAILIAHLRDENGINLSKAGIGHEIIGILDGDADNPIILNDFYTADLNKYQSGIVRYPFKGLTSGKHSLIVRVWDTHNNSAQTETSFVVEPSNKIALSDVKNYPNPASNFTTFRFGHNKAGKTLQVHIEIFNTLGKHVQTLQAVIPFAPEIAEVRWEMPYSLSQFTGRGLFVYQLHVFCPEDSTSGESRSKMVILR
jgi:hypothetical protein